MDGNILPSILPQPCNSFYNNRSKSSVENWIEETSQPEIPIYDDADSNSNRDSYTQYTTSSTLFTNESKISKLTKSKRKASSHSSNIWEWFTKHGEGKVQCRLCKRSLQ